MLAAKKYRHSFVQTPRRFAQNTDASFRCGRLLAFCERLFAAFLSDYNENYDHNVTKRLRDEYNDHVTTTVAGVL